MTYPPIAVLGGLGAARLVELARAARAAGVPDADRDCGALAFQFLWYAPVVRATTEEAWAARADVRFAQSFAAELPAELLRADPQPGHVPALGRQRRADCPLVVRIPLMSVSWPAAIPAASIVHWNFWCNVQDPVQPEFCRKALALKSFELVRESRANQRSRSTASRTSYSVRLSLGSRETCGEPIIRLACMAFNNPRRRAVSPRRFAPPYRKSDMHLSARSGHPTRLRRSDA